MNVPRNYIHQRVFSHTSLPWNGAPVFIRSVTPAPPAQGISLGELLVGAAVVAAVICGTAELVGVPAHRTCGECGRAGHDRRSCPHDGERISFSRAIPRSNRCDCCGSSRYGTQRHHTRGRSVISDFLDVCFDCHIECCHGGHFHNLGAKPRTCRIADNRSLWCK